MNNGTQDLFSFLAVGRKPSFAQLVFNLSTVSVPVLLFQVDVVVVVCHDQVRCQIIQSP